LTFPKSGTTDAESKNFVVDCTISYIYFLREMRVKIQNILQSPFFWLDVWAEFPNIFSINAGKQKKKTLPKNLRIRTDLSTSIYFLQ